MHKFKKKIDKVVEKSLILLEAIIAIISVVVLVVMLGTSLYQIVTDPSFFMAEHAVSEYLHKMLSIVVALEFIKLLLHLTPANIVEVLSMAIARGIILNHENALDNLLGIACIVGLFAAKRYLIPKAELHREMDEEIVESNSHGHRHRHGKSNKQK